MKKNEVAEAIILKKQEYREKDELITALSKDQGRITVVARGVLSLQSKNASSLLPGSTSELVFNTEGKRALYSLARSSFMVSRAYLLNDLEKSTCFQVIAEIIDHLTSGMEEDPKANYELTAWALDALKDHDPKLVLSLFISNALKLFGIEPYVDGCVSCGDPHVIAFSVEEGGFICPACAEKLNVTPEDVSFMKQLRIICKAAPKNIDVCAQLDRIDEINDRLIAFYERHSGARVKSYAFWRKVTS